VSDEPGFLSRWSRRKQALARGEEVAEAPPPEPPAAPSPPVAPPEAALAEAPAPEPPFDPATLPDLETLDAASDFAAFLKPGVPAALRNAALRKAWLLDPLIRDHMSPLDYAWDFNSPGGLPHGFASELGEAAEVVRDLLARAVGLHAPEPGEGEGAPPEAELPEGPVLAVAAPSSPPVVALPAPEATALGPDAPADGVPDPAPASGEPPAPPPRRHGGALPT
jgi:hypothetical protein